MKKLFILLNNVSNKEELKKKFENFPYDDMTPTEPGYLNNFLVSWSSGSKFFQTDCKFSHDHSFPNNEINSDSRFGYNIQYARGPAFESRRDPDYLFGFCFVFHCFMATECSCWFFFGWCFRQEREECPNPLSTVTVLAILLIHQDPES
jgi:hypothetical protein